MLRLRIAVLALCFAPALHAANLLVNPHFEVGIVGWKPSANYLYFTSAWQKADASFAPNSGSLLATLNDPVGNVYASMMQCVAVTPGADYDAGVKMMIVGGQNPVRGGLLLRMYPSGDCSGSALSSQIAAWDVGQPTNGRFTPVALRDVGMPSNVHSIGVELIVSGGPGPITVNFDDAYFAAAGGCVPDDRMLCLDGGRFSVSASYVAPGSTSKAAHMVQLTPDTAYMWFFDQNNVEVTIKVLNACSISTNHWVFSSGLTNVQVSISVTDTLTGARQTYSNPQGTFYQPNFDTSAFSCP